MSGGWDAWRDTGYYVEPANLALLMTVISRIGVWQPGQRFAWRGLRDAAYALSSSLQRQPTLTTDETELRRREDAMLLGARQWGLGVSRYGLLDDLQLLTDLQHHGVPTHLVDVTYNPMTALWFAAVGPGDRDGLLLAINTTGWREISPGEAPVTWDDMEAGSTRRAAFLDTAPFVLQVPDPNARMAAQEGFFVSGKLPPETNGPIHSFTVEYTPRAGGPLDLLKDPASSNESPLPFVAIRVSASLKGRLVEALARSFNRTEPVLFPDYQGYRDWVERGNQMAHHPAQQGSAPSVAR